MRRLFHFPTCLALAALLLPGGAWAGGTPPQWPAAAIPAALRENAHAVVRQRDDILTVQSAGRTVHTARLVVTVLDEQGDDWGQLALLYDKLNQINYLRGRQYNAAGMLQKSLKSYDVKDRSAVSDFSLYEDNRMRIADMRQSAYPYTVDFEYEEVSQIPLTFPVWQPQEQEHLSIEHATLRVTTPPALPLRYQEHLMPAGSHIAQGEAQKGELVYAWQLVNQPALEREPSGPRLSELAPAVYTAPTRIDVQGHAGELTSWESLGAWGYALNQGRAELPADMQTRVASLVQGVSDERTKVRKVYEYLQSNTRYISIQLGIGGLQTFPASTVAATGYGDCKALSNYCMAMLKTAGIESHCAWVGSGKGRGDVRTSFPSDQFDHVILCVPLRQGPKPDTVWLECTSQTEAFGYMGNFTGNRHALLLTPQGGRLVRTPTYATADNRQFRRAEVQVDEQGNARATVRTVSTGLQQDDLAQLMSYLPPDEQRKRTYARLGLPSVTIEQSNWQADHHAPLPAVVERLTLALPRYASLTGRRLFLTPNLLNRHAPPPARIGERRTALVLPVGFVDADTVQFRVPAGYKPESVPTPVQLDTPFGTYSSQIKMLPDGQVQYIRRLQMPAARFEPKEYEAYETFCRRISQADRTQVVLVKSDS